jgi:hypothetical protein
MTDPTTDRFPDLNVPDEPAERLDIDLVPGDPPVPITVWRTPAGEGGLSPRLAARVLAAYTRTGDVMFDATSDQVLADAAHTAGRRYTTRHTPPATDADTPAAALAVAGWPLPGDIDPAIVLGGLARRLRRGGVLDVVIADPYRDGMPVEVGPLVLAARAARLSYLQHIVAVHGHVDGDQITSTQPGRAARVTPEVLARLGDAAHVRVHADLLVFSRGQADD